MPRISTLKTLVILAASILSLLAFSPVSHAGTTTYIYDEFDRLKEVDTSDGQALIYDYNEIGNLRGKSKGIPPCTTGYAFSSADNLCEKNPCPSGYAINTTTNKCDGGSVTSYLSSCPLGSYNNSTSRCEGDATPTTIGNFTLPVYKNPSCSASECYLGPYYMAGYAIQGYISTTPFTGSLPVYDRHDGNLYTTGSTLLGYISAQSFKDQYLHNASPVYANTILGLGTAYAYKATTSAAGYIATTSGGGPTTWSCSLGNLSSNICWAAPVCPNGGTLQGTACTVDTRTQTDPVCTGGAYSAAIHKCYMNASALKDFTINSRTATTTSPTVTLTLSCRDNVGSCSQVQLSNDNVNWSAPVAFATQYYWTLSSGDGAKTVYAKIMNSSGTWTTPVSAPIFLDATLPTTTASALGGIYPEAQTVALTCNDGNGSGCNKIYYTTDGTTPTTASSTYVGALSVSTTTTLKYFAIDFAGNSEAVKSQAYSIGCTGNPVRIPGKSSYATLQDAYNSAADGYVIQTLATDFFENFTANRNILVTIDGGYNCDYSSNPDKTVIRRMPHITSGTVTMKNFRISN